MPTKGSVQGQRSAVPASAAAAWATPGAMTNVAAARPPHRHRFIGVGGSAVAGRDYQATPGTTIAANRAVTGSTAADAAQCAASQLSAAWASTASGTLSDS